MRRCELALAAVALLLAAQAAMGAPEAFVPKVTDVTIFKDGHALIMARAKAKVEDGWCRTRAVPVPVLGTFWTYVADDKARVEFVRAGFVETQESRRCMNFDEMIQANKGKWARIVTGSDKYEGIIRGILEYEKKTEDVTTRSTQPGRDAWGRYVNPPEVREAAETETTARAEFLMLEVEGRTQLIKRGEIRDILLEGKQPATVHTEKKKVREISIRLTRNGKPAAGEAEVGMVYLQKGIRWIPDYRVELLADGKARVTLHGTIINDIADLEDVSLNLVVGVPSFIMKEQISPLALREVGLRLSSYFLPPRRDGGPSSHYQYLSNVMMSQGAGPVMRPGGAAAAGPDIPGEGQMEDLFLYHKDGLTLKKGERAVVHLMETTVPYEDVYTWDVPSLPPREMWRHVGSDQQRQLAALLTGAKAMHKVRLTNSGKQPWTTGPAMIFKDGAPLGQQLMTYTSVKNEVDLPVTIATDVNTKKEETELQRKRNISIGDNNYTQVLAHGKLTVTNFKDRPIRIIVTRHVIGNVTKATDDGEITRSNTIEDTSVDRGAMPWYYWNWPWWWHGVNAVSQIRWETTIKVGKAATFEYDWDYYYRN